MIEYHIFYRTLKNLEDQYSNYKQLDKDLPKLMQEAVQESVIQRFKICYDSMWKVLKRYLGEELGLADPPNSPKPIFRCASENELLSSPVKIWLGYADARNNTTHKYGEEKVTACLELMGGFIDDAIGLYQTMSGKDWE